MPATNRKTVPLSKKMLADLEQEQLTKTALSKEPAAAALPPALAPEPVRASIEITVAGDWRGSLVVKVGD